MDLVFKKRVYRPSPEFWGDFSRNEFRDHFGFSSTYLVNLEIKGNVYGFTFDTGAFISYAPDFLLEHMGTEPSFEGYVRGATPKEECKIKVKVAKLSFRIQDDMGKESTQLSAWFAFHPFDRGPFLLGMKDVIEKMGLIMEWDEEKLILQI